MKESIFEIVSNRVLNATVSEMILTGDTSALSRPGQFVNVKLDGLYLRRPISVCDDDEKSLTLVYRAVGEGTRRMRAMGAGEKLNLLVGLGNGYDTALAGEVPLLVGGGVGVPPLFHLARKLIGEGKRVRVLLGFRNKADVFYEEEFKALGASVTVVTEDGSYGRRGNVCMPLGELFDAGRRFDKVITIGPLIMMKFVTELTRPTGIPCVVSMNPIMIDGTGMCGGCRLTLNSDGKRVTKFACVDGPDFNGYEVDFDEAMSRGGMYRTFERHEYEKTCNLFGEVKD